MKEITEDYKKGWSDASRAMIGYVYSLTHPKGPTGYVNEVEILSAMREVETRINGK